MFGLSWNTVNALTLISIYTFCLCDSGTKFRFFFRIHSVFNEVQPKPIFDDIKMMDLVYIDFVCFGKKQSALTKTIFIFWFSFFSFSLTNDVWFNYTTKVSNTRTNSYIIVIFFSVYINLFFKFSIRIPKLITIIFYICYIIFSIVNMRIKIPTYLDQTNPDLEKSPDWFYRSKNTIWKRKLVMA